MSCRICGAENVNFFTYVNPLTAEEAQICQSCEGDNLNFTTDAWGNRYPRYMNLPMITAYDGETTRCMDNPNILFEIPCTTDDLFTCEHCGNEFYGCSCQIEDLDQYWCQYCADHNAHWDDWSEHYYADEDSFPEHDDPPPPVARPRNTEEHGFRRHVGEATNMFLSGPLVGIEFEHAPVALVGHPNSCYEMLFDLITAGSYMPEIPWRSMFTLHSDGSITNMNRHCSSEVVTMPASGNMLDAIISRFYEPFADGRVTPGPEHHSCGFHVHV